MKNRITVFGRRGMMFLCAIALAAVIGLALAGCPTDGGATPSGGYDFTTPGKYLEMVSLAGGAITGSGSDGAFVSGRSVTLSAFNIAKYEITYELWKEVYDWAAAHGYSIANEGREGLPNADDEPGKGTDNSSEWTAEEKRSRPVTRTSWRDAIVWCNAYSEMNGKAPVYYTDTTYTTVLKTSANTEGTATAADTAVMKPNAKGYRLPTEAEWEYAARGGNTSAPAWNYTYAGTNTGGTSPISIFDSALDGYAWYYSNANNLDHTNKNYGTHPVGTKPLNSAGLYDMSGNVAEWCWDWYDATVAAGAATNPSGPASGSKRVARGGHWGTNADRCTVSYRNSVEPSSKLVNHAFRVVCSQ
jgi:formylglycine-generating enzyme required for sulfatase activity